MLIKYQAGVMPLSLSLILNPAPTAYFVSARRLRLFLQVAVLGVSIVGVVGCGRENAEGEEVVKHLEEASLKADDERGFVAGSYVVAFKSYQSKARYASFRSENAQFYLNQLPQSSLAQVASIRLISNVDMNQVFQSASLTENQDFSLVFSGLNQAGRAFLHEPLPSAVIASVVFEKGVDGEAYLEQAEKDGELWFYEPNYINELPQNANPFGNLAKTYESMGSWWHEQIKLNAAYQALSSKGALSSPVVAVLDSGLDIEHPQLRNRVWQNAKPGESGCANDLYGCDTTKAKKGSLGNGNIAPFGTTGYGQTCPTDLQECSHGTHVSGIIAAEPSGGVGGVCPVCRILSIKIIQNLNGRGAALDTAILDGLKYLTLFRQAQGPIVRVANSSFGKYARSKAVALLVNILKSDPYYVLVVGAASNEDSMQRAYPAALNDAIAVAAVGPDEGKAKYSNFGPWVDVAAPGGSGVKSASEAIESTVPGGSTESKSGTSMASPVVAGVVGLILSFDPNRSHSALKSSIVNTADPRLYNSETAAGLNFNYYYPKAADDNVRRPLLGSGILDAAAALENSTNTGVASSAYDRVNRGCGVIMPSEKLSSQAAIAKWGMLLLIVLPVFLIYISHNQKNRAGYVRRIHR